MLHYDPGTGSPWGWSSSTPREGARGKCLPEGSELGQGAGRRTRWRAGERRGRRRASPLRSTHTHHVLGDTRDRLQPLRNPVVRRLPHRRQEHTPRAKGTPHRPPRCTLQDRALGRKPRPCARQAQRIETTLAGRRTTRRGSALPARPRGPARRRSWGAALRRRRRRRRPGHAMQGGSRRRNIKCALLRARDPGNVRHTHVRRVDCPFLCGAHVSPFVARAAVEGLERPQGRS